MNMTIQDAARYVAGDEGEVDQWALRWMDRHGFDQTDMDVFPAIEAFRQGLRAALWMGKDRTRVLYREVALVASVCTGQSVLRVMNDDADAIRDVTLTMNDASEVDG